MTRNIYLICLDDYESTKPLCAFPNKKAAVKRVEELTVSWAHGNCFRTAQGYTFNSFSIAEVPLFE